MLPPELEPAPSTTARMPTFVSAHLRMVAVPTPLQPISPAKDVVREPHSPAREIASVVVAALSITACVAALSWLVFVSIFP